MGMAMSFTQVTPEELEQARKDRTWARELADPVEPAGRPPAYLDKAWDGIEFLLTAAKVPVSLSYTGVLIQDRRNLDEDGHEPGFDEDYDGPLLSAWTAEQVERAAQQLRATPFARLAPHFDPARMAARDVYPSVIWERDADTLDYLRTHYETLRQFFDTAARSGSGAIMCLA